MSGKTHLLLEDKYIPLPDHNKQNYESPILTNKGGNWRRSYQKDINLCLKKSQKEIRLTKIDLGQIQRHANKKDLVQQK